MQIESDKIRRLEEKIEQMKAQVASEKARLKKKAKKDDTRRKILVGAYFMEKYKDDVASLAKELDPFLKREKDRMLFGLDVSSPPVDSQKQD